MSTVNDREMIWEYRDSLRSELEVASDFVRRITDKLHELGWTENDIFAVRMALGEAMINAIKHGHKFDSSKPVEVLIRIGETSFYARIKDQGNGFDPDTVPDPSADANLDKTSGRGVALIRNFVDSVSYNAAGNAIEFRKSKSPVN